MNLLSLPNDVLIYTLGFLSIKDLNYLSQTNSRFFKLTNNDYLWELKSQLDYNTLINKRRIKETWKTFYLDMLKHRLVSIICKSQTYNKIFIGLRFTLKEITDNITNLSPNITLLFSSYNKELLAFSTYNKDGEYFEKIYEDNKWILTIHEIKVLKCGIDKYWLKGDLAAIRCSLLTYLK